MKTIAFVLTIFAAGSIANAMNVQDDECIFTNDIRNVEAVSDNSLSVDSLQGNYTVTGQSCNNLMFAMHIQFMPFSSFELCTGDEIRTEIESCIITQIKKN